MENENKENEIVEEKVENVGEKTVEPDPIFPIENNQEIEPPKAVSPAVEEIIPTETSVEAPTPVENKVEEIVEDEPIVDVVESNQIEKSFFAAEEIQNEEPTKKEETSNIEKPLVEEAPKVEEPVAPQIVTPKVEENKNPEQKGKTNTVVVALLIVLVLLICVGICVLVIYLNKDKNNSSVEDDSQVVSSEKKVFLNLANKYVDAVEVLWKSNSMLCQNINNPEELLHPSDLPSQDKYNNPAYYYVFIDTLNSTEMNIGVDKQKDVAGWIRIGKNDNSFYVALSDGINYIVDKGTEYGIKSTSLTEEEVIITGNGNSYQYFEGRIFGSNTNGNGWGIGDYKISTDGDDSNDGIYMTNGLKTAGWTPYCVNIK